MIVAGVEPSPANPDWPRHSSGPCPAYRFVPRNSPRARLNPESRFYGIPLVSRGLDIADLMNRLDAPIATEQAPPILLALRLTDHHPHT